MAELIISFGGRDFKPKSTVRIPLHPLTKAEKDRRRRAAVKDRQTERSQGRARKAFERGISI